MLRMITCTVVCVLLMLGSTWAGRAQSSAGVPAKTAEQTWTQMERRLDSGDYVKVKAQECDSAPTLKSLKYDTPTVLRFKNATKGEVKYYWINYEGTREQERTLNDGESQNVRTYVTHPFMVVGATGTCMAIYMPQADPGLI